MINDTCGHTVYDELLVRTTKVIKSQIGERDTPPVLAVMSSAFAATLHQAEEALKRLRRIRGAVATARFIWQSILFEISISIGLVEINDQVQDQVELLSCADLACHTAGDPGRKGIVWFTPDDAEYNKRRTEMQWAPRPSKQWKITTRVLPAIHAKPVKADGASR